MEIHAEGGEGADGESGVGRGPASESCTQAASGVEVEVVGGGPSGT